MDDHEDVNTKMSFGNTDDPGFNNRINYTTSIFSIKVMVKVTGSLTLVSFERDSQVKQVCQGLWFIVIWSTIQYAF